MTTTTTTPVVVRVGIPAWLRQDRNLATRLLEGTIVKRTARSITLRGCAAVFEADHCHRCGRKIEHPASRFLGFGPDCCEKVGIQRAHLDAMIDGDNHALDALIERVHGSTQGEWQFPLSKITVTTLAGEPIAVEGNEHQPLDNFIAAPAAAVAGEGELGDEGRIERTDTATVTLRVQGDRIVIGAPFKFKDAIKEHVNGRRWDAKVKAWTAPASASTAATLATMFDRETVDTDAAFKALLKQAAARTIAAHHKDATELPPIPSTATTPWHHQLQAYHFMHDLDAGGLFMDMGTGKSKVVVDLIVNRGHRRVLIVCPRAVVGVWPKQFGIHAAVPVECCATRRVDRKTELSGNAKAQLVRDTLAQWDARGVERGVVIVNYDAAWRQELGDVLLAYKWDCVVLDESHKIKAPGGKASQFCGRLGKHAAHRLALTGTPMPHSPLDVYAQYRFLDQGIFGTSFANFRARYAVMGGYGGHEVLGFQRQDDLAERMYSIAFRVMADDVLDLPDYMHEVLTCDFEPKARKIYGDLADELFAECEAGTISASNALVKLLRLQQLTGGILALDPDDESGDRAIEEVSSAKRELLADTLDNLATTEPVVVFCKFTPDLANVRAVCEKQGRRYGELSGKSKSGITADSTMRDDVDVIGVQIQSGGAGIDLTRASYAFYYSTGYSLGDYDQSLKRLHRPGQERHVRYYHLHVNDTIDSRVYDALANRRDVVEFVLGMGS